MYNLRNLLLAALLLGALAMEAHGATYYFSPSGSSGDWNTAGNWKTGTSCSNLTGDGAVPSASDDAFICNNKTATITSASAVARTVTINLGGRVQMLPTSADHR